MSGMSTNEAPDGTEIGTEGAKTGGAGGAAAAASTSFAVISPFGPVPRTIYQYTREIAQR